MVVWVGGGSVAALGAVEGGMELDGVWHGGCGGGARCPVPRAQCPVPGARCPVPGL